MDDQYRKYYEDYYQKEYADHYVEEYDEEFRRYCEDRYRQNFESHYPTEINDPYLKTINDRYQKEYENYQERRNDNNHIVLPSERNDMPQKIKDRRKPSKSSEKPKPTKEESMLNDIYLHFGGEARVTQTIELSDEEDEQLCVGNKQNETIIALNVSAVPIDISIDNDEDAILIEEDEPSVIIISNHLIATKTVKTKSTCETETSKCADIQTLPNDVYRKRKLSTDIITIDSDESNSDTIGYDDELCKKMAEINNLAEPPKDSCKETLINLDSKDNISATVATLANLLCNEKFGLLKSALRIINNDVVNPEIQSQPINNLNIDIGNIDTSASFLRNSSIQSSTNVQYSQIQNGISIGNINTSASFLCEADNVEIFENILSSSTDILGMNLPQHISPINSKDIQFQSKITTVPAVSKQIASNSNNVQISKHRRLCWRRGRISRFSPIKRTTSAEELTKLPRTISGTRRSSHNDAVHGKMKVDFNKNIIKMKTIKKPIMVQEKKTEVNFIKFSDYIANLTKSCEINANDKCSETKNAKKTRNTQLVEHKSSEKKPKPYSVPNINDKFSKIKNIKRTRNVHLIGYKPSKEKPKQDSVANNNNNKSSEIKNIKRTRNVHLIEHKPSEEKPIQDSVANINDESREIKTVKTTRNAHLIEQKPSETKPKLLKLKRGKIISSDEENEESNTSKKITKQSIKINKRVDKKKLAHKLKLSKILYSDEDSDVENAFEHRLSTQETSKVQTSDTKKYKTEEIASKHKNSDVKDKSLQDFKSTNIPSNKLSIHILENTVIKNKESMLNMNNKRGNINNISDHNSPLKINKADLKSNHSYFKKLKTNVNVQPNDIDFKNNSNLALMSNKCTDLNDESLSNNEKYIYKKVFHTNRRSVEIVKNDTSNSAPQKEKIDITEESIDKFFPTVSKCDTITLQVTQQNNQSSCDTINNSNNKEDRSDKVTENKNKAERKPNIIGAKQNVGNAIDLSRNGNELKEVKSQLPRTCEAMKSKSLLNNLSIVAIPSNTMDTIIPKIHTLPEGRINQFDLRTSTTHSLKHTYEKQDPGTNSGSISTNDVPFQDIIEIIEIPQISQSPLTVTASYSMPDDSTKILPIQLLEKQKLISYSIRALNFEEPTNQVNVDQNVTKAIKAADILQAAPKETNSAIAVATHADHLLSNTIVPDHLSENQVINTCVPLNVPSTQSSASNSKITEPVLNPTTSSIVPASSLQSTEPYVTSMKDFLAAFTFNFVICVMECNLNKKIWLKVRGTEVGEDIKSKMYQYNHVQKSSKIKNIGELFDRSYLKDYDVNVLFNSVEVAMAPDSHKHVCVCMLDVIRQLNVTTETGIFICKTIIDKCYIVRDDHPNSYDALKLKYTLISKWQEEQLNDQIKWYNSSIRYTSVIQRTPSTQNNISGYQINQNSSVNSQNIPSEPFVRYTTASVVNTSSSASTSYDPLLNIYTCATSASTVNTPSTASISYDPLKNIYTCSTSSNQNILKSLLHVQAPIINNKVSKNTTKKLVSTTKPTYKDISKAAAPKHIASQTIGSMNKSMSTIQTQSSNPGHPISMHPQMFGTASNSKTVQTNPTRQHKLPPYINGPVHNKKQASIQHRQMLGAADKTNYPYAIASEQQLPTKVNNSALHPHMLQAALGQCLPLSFTSPVQPSQMLGTTNTAYHLHGLKLQHLQTNHIQENLAKLASQQSNYSTSTQTSDVLRNCPSGGYGETNKHTNPSYIFHYKPQEKYVGDTRSSQQDKSIPAQSTSEHNHTNENFRVHIGKDNLDCYFNAIQTADNDLILPMVPLPQPTIFKQEEKFIDYMQQSELTETDNSIPISLVDLTEVSSTPTLNKCICGKNAVSICDCNTAVYCSRDCQIIDFTAHSSKCSKSNVR